MSTYPNSKNTLREDVQNTIYSSSIHIKLQDDVLLSFHICLLGIKRDKNIATCANIIVGIRNRGEKITRRHYLVTTSFGV